MVFLHVPAGVSCNGCPCTLTCKIGRRRALTLKLPRMKLRCQETSTCVWIARWGGTQHIGVDVRCIMIKGPKMSMGLNRLLLGLSGCLRTLGCGGRVHECACCCSPRWKTETRAEEVVKATAVVRILWRAMIWTGFERTSLFGFFGKRLEKVVGLHESFKNNSCF